MKTLEPGEYIIPDNHIAKRTGNVLTVRPCKKSHSTAANHCRDCRFLGRGRTQKGWMHDTSCCLARKKCEGIYYVAYPQDRACELYEQRTNPRGC